MTGANFVVLRRPPHRRVSPAFRVIGLGIMVHGLGFIVYGRDLRFEVSCPGFHISPERVAPCAMRLAIKFEERTDGREEERVLY